MPGDSPTSAKKGEKEATRFERERERRERDNRLQGERQKGRKTREEKKSKGSGKERREGRGERREGESRQTAERDKVTGHVGTGVVSWLMERACVCVCGFNKGLGACVRGLPASLFEHKSTGQAFHPPACWDHAALRGPCSHAQLVRIATACVSSPSTCSHR